MDGDLELYVYLVLEKERGHSYESFANELGISSTTLTKIKNYYQRPSPQLAMKIEEKTKGKVIWWKLVQKCQEGMEIKRNSRTK